jgi:hypothetical protein
MRACSSSFVCVAVAVFIAAPGVAPPANGQQGWSGSVATLSAQDSGASLRKRPALAADAAGNVVAVWVQPVTEFAAVLQAARYSAAARAWGTPVTLSGAGIPTEPRLVVDSAGNALAVWGMFNGPVQAARYLWASNAWTGPIDVDSGILFADELDLVADAAGNAFAVWLQRNTSPGIAETVRAARFSGGSNGWGAVVDLSDSSRPAWQPRIAVDASGNATVLWVIRVGTSLDWVVHARRYVAGGGWTEAVELSSGGSAEPLGSDLRIVSDSTGQMTAAWSLSQFDEMEEITYRTVQARRYTPATGSWGPVVDLSAPGGDARWPKLAADGTGGAFAAWLQSLPDADAARVQGARFSTDAGGWSAPVDLGPPGDGDRDLELVADHEGNAVVIWIQTFDVPVPLVALQAARYAAATASWGAAVNLEVSSEGTIGRAHQTAADSLGNVLAVWDYGTRAARFVVTAGAWTPSVDLVPASLTIAPGTGRVVVDPLGNATLAFNRFYRVPQVSDIASTRWVAAPLAPTLGIVSPGAGSLIVAFSPPLTSEPLFAPTNYAYSIDDGATWHLRDPASTTSPLVIGGLTDFVPYRVRLVAINRAGPGLASSSVLAVPHPVPLAPRELTATSIVGNTVMLSWIAPQGGIPPTGYVLEGGVHSGEVLASIPTGSIAPQFTFEAPAGTYYVRVHAVAGTLRSAPSNEIQIVVRVPAPPSAPANLRGLVNGSDVALSWTNTFEGGAPTSLRLSVTGGIETVLPLPMGETFTYANVPPGTYTLRIVAANAVGISPFSNEVTLTFPGPCTGVPGVPVNLQTWKVGSTIFASWDAPASGPAATGYGVFVTGAYVGAFATTARTLSGVAGPGEYVISVAATNACGTGPATASQAVAL